MRKGSSVCGIAGMLGPRGADPTVLGRMAACLAHRGPDDEGVWTDEREGIGLAHRRLAVLGLGAAGAQPMVSRSGRYTLVYNGEIYNHLELRRALETEGASVAWQGGSDTETVLAAVEAWGLRNTIRRCIGMFALALWDREDRTLTLVRDRLGEKPLTYAWVGNTFVFASQPSALETVPGFDPPIDRTSLAGMLRFAVVPDGRSIHEGVSKLPPGSLLVVRGASERRLEPESYWSFSDAARDGVESVLPGDDRTYLSMVDEAVTDAVRGQLLADVPVGAFLSGGIDSSLIVATMQRLSSRPVRTFTIGFEEDGYDESGHARAVAKHLGTDHTEMILSAEQALDLIPELPHVYDEPFADSSQIPTLLVSRLAREQVTVALSGDGGDELFAGYTRYFQAERLARLPRVVGHGASIVFGLLGQPRRRSLGKDVTRGEWAIVRRLLSHNPEAERFVLGVDDRAADLTFRRLWQETDGLGGITRRFMALDTQRYLNDDILHKVDRAAMAVSLETRVPLLDHRIVELAWRLPLHVHVRDGVGKWVLRELLARDVPRQLFERPKAGFGIPVGRWLRGALRPWAEDLLAPGPMRQDGLLDVDRVRRLWNEHASGRWDAGAELWPILMFQAWYSGRRSERSGR